MLLFLGYPLSKMINDRYRYYQLASTTAENESSARVHQTLVAYIESSPRRVLLSKEKTKE